MSNIKLLSNSEALQTEFHRCSEEYTHLEMYVAWVGNPKNIIPYDYLDNLESVKVFVGIAFDQTSPEGIEYLLDNKCKVIIVNAKEIYHPKLYFFSSKSKSSLLIGSSNFTYSGFSENVEGNVLIEGKEHKQLIEKYLAEIRKSIKMHDLFIPDEKWLIGYKIRYQNRQKNFKKAKVKDEAIREDNLAASSSWLANAGWDIYIKHFRKGMSSSEERFKEGLERKLELFDEYDETLPVPWKPSLFSTIENRRRLLGSSGYGWLGHVGASGKFRQLLANGSEEEKRSICNSVNKIAELKMPLDYKVLKRELNNLTNLGPSVKVWGRFLAITRPDLYCTISSNDVRGSLSILLEKPSSYFETVDGYIDLLKLIHQSPWYNSLKPANKVEIDTWKRRVAFLDVVLY